MIKRFCDFCGKEIDSGIIRFNVDEHGHRHTTGRIELELCKECGIEFLNKVVPNWKKEKEEHDRKCAERKAERERKKAEADQRPKPKVVPSINEEIFYDEDYEND